MLESDGSIGAQVGNIGTQIDLHDVGVQTDLGKEPSPHDVDALIVGRAGPRDIAKVLDTTQLIGDKVDTFSASFDQKIEEQKKADAEAMEYTKKVDSLNLKFNLAILVLTVISVLVSLATFIGSPAGSSFISFITSLF